jgi:hypothetical protein
MDKTIITMLIVILIIILFVFTCNENKKTKESNTCFLVGHYLDSCSLWKAKYYKIILYEKEPKSRKQEKKYMTFETGTILLPDNILNKNF